MSDELATTPRDLRTESTAAWAQNIATETDNIIREGLNRRLGEGWTLADLRGRITSVRYQGDKFETLSLDGVPFLELHDLEFPPPAPFKPGEPCIVTATRNYRFLTLDPAKSD